MNRYNNNFTGARWWKFDFHTHTPASPDYGREDMTPEEWLLDHMKAGIDCVAVTDHNSGEWIDKLKDAYLNMKNAPPPDFREIFIFPGVEIMISDNIHLLAIFDPDKTTYDISALLGACGYKGNAGETETAAEKSSIKAVKEIDSRGGIPIPAHADKDKGLFKENKGVALKSIINLPELYACQVTDINCELPELYKSKKTKWSFIYGSDSHTPDQVGRYYTWVKMGTPSFEGLKLALIDGGDFSLIPHKKGMENPNNHSEFIIKSLKIENARYCGRDGQPFYIEFSPWLNCLIGGRGTGKSTIIEFLRIVMRKEKELELLGEESDVYKTFKNFKQADETEEAKGALLQNTRGEAECILDKADFKVSWAADGSLSPIMEIDKDGNPKESPGEISSRFPISIYSQKQIFEIASDPRALLAIIDQAPEVKYQEWKSEYDQICARYRSLKSEIREFDITIKEENRLLGSLEDIKRKLAIFQQGKHANILKEYQKKYYQKKEIENFLTSLEENEESLAELNIETIAPKLDIFDDTDDVKKIIEDYIKKAKDLNDKLSELKTEVSELQKNFSKTLPNTKWQKNFDETADKFETLKEKLRAEGIESPNEYGSFIQKKQTIEAKIKYIKKLKIAKQKGEKDRKELLDEIRSHRSKLTKQRKKFISEVLQGNSFIKIEIEECAEKGDALEKEFRDSIRCTDDKFQRDIDKLLSDLKGVNDSAESRLEKLSDLKKRIKKIKAEEYEGDIQDKRFLNHIRNNVSEEMLDTLDVWYPEDKLTVSYQRENKFVSMEQGSKGQKTAAILSFLLAYGYEPIIFDQPEDDLDNRLIFDLVVKQIRENKKRRQIIVATHNSNIVVNGDAEMIDVFDFNNGQCKVVEKGCLQQKDIRSKICEIMEGGKTAFERRFKRINIG